MRNWRPMNRSTATPRHLQSVNLSTPERLASVIGGGALAVWGAQKRTFPGLAMAAVGGFIMYRGATGHCDVYQALGMHSDHRRGRQRGVPYELGIRVDKSVTINKPRAEVYKFWRNFENLPRFMRHLESVTEVDNRHSHWVAKAPAGRTVAWEAEIINEIENELIGWQSMENATVENAGSVHFEDAPGGRGTVVRIELQYNPPGGSIGAALAKLFGEEPGQQISEDLWRFKQLMEAGEIATTSGQPHGTRSASVKALHGLGLEKKSRKSWRRDVVTEASEESFPASDAPSWTPEALSH